MNKVIVKKPVGLSAGKIVLLVFLFLLFLLLTFVWIFLNFYAPPPGDDFMFSDLPGWDWDFEDGVFADKEMEDEEHPEGVALGEIVAQSRKQGESYTFLILGRDGDGLLTDTMMLLFFNVKDSRINILSIPRDTYINNSSYRGGKINSVLGAAYNPSRRAGKSSGEAMADGINFLRQMLKVTFGIPVDYYISMDLSGFRAIVDAVDGVELEVPERMFYQDPEQKLFIDLQKGWQKLDGKKAEQFVRYRQYRSGDLGRVQAQKTFISALAKKMLKFDLAQIERLFNVADKHVTHNLTARAVAWFPSKVLGVKLENITLHTVPGEAFYVGKLSCYSIYRAETIKLINEYYNPYTTEIPESNFNIFEGSRIYANQSDFTGVTMDKLTGN